MKKLYYLIVLTVILGLVLTGCFLSNVGQVPTTEQSGITYLTKGIETDPDVFTLYADQDIDVGTVSVWDDCVDLYVKYETTGGWVMTETHLAVVANSNDFPMTKKGNPIPGQFPYQCCYDETEEEWLFVKKPEDLVGTCDADGNDLLTEITYIIPLGSDTELHIAAHASLLKLVDTVEVYADKLTPTDSNVPLESGKNYLLKASGTAFAGDTIDFDAKYSITRKVSTDGWTDFVTNYEGYGAELLELAVDGDFVDWGLYNEDHIYYWNMDGIGSCVPLWIYDIHYGTNDRFLTVEIYQEESAWAGTEEGEIQFDGKNWATYFNYGIEVDLPPTISSEDLAGPFTEGVLGEFHVKTVNPGCGVAYPNVLFNYIIEGISTSEINTFDYWYFDDDTSMWKWGEMPKENDGLGNVTGFFGPWPDGFEMTVPYTAETKFRINITTPDTYTVEMTLDDLNSPFEQLAFFTEDVVVSPETVLAIGDSYGGGKVAYIFVEGDNGYVLGEQHGLIAATEDQSAGIIWALPAHQGTSVPGTLLTIGSGLANTDKIITQNGTGSTYAAGLARAYSGGGNIDWFLPSQDELNKLYLSKGTIGGFADGEYWSSSEYGASHAWYQNFIGGYKGNYFKYFSRWVRAVRAF